MAIAAVVAGVMALGLAWLGVLWQIEDNHSDVGRWLEHVSSSSLLMTILVVPFVIGAAGVSAVPMAARVVQKVGAEANQQNFLLMHAMGPNVAGVIGSAIAAGVLLSLIKV